MDYASLMDGFKRIDPDWLLAGQVFAAVFLALLLDLLQKAVLRRLEKRIVNSRTRWDDALYQAIRRPLSVLIWILGITFAADIVAQQTEAPIFGVVGPARDVAVIAILAWFLFRFIEALEKEYLDGGIRGRPVDPTTVDAVAKLARVSVVITAFLIGLQTLGFSISGILAFGGIGGLAVGFAAKDLLANFFGGLMIYLDRPFAVGDWVRSPEREIEGTVEHIGWRLTRIRTFDKRPLYIPNATFAAIAVENPSRMTHRRIYETIGVRYNDIARLPAIVADVKQMLQNHPEIDSGQTLMVNFNTFSASSLDFFIYTFTRTTIWAEYHAVKQDVLFRISDIITAHGAEIAFPTSTVHVPDRVALEMPREAVPAARRAGR